MNREQILDALKDLVATLRSPNFEGVEIRERWREKYVQVKKALEGLSVKDLKWLTKEYQVWHKQNVAPHIDRDLLELTRKENFWWI